MQTTDRPEHWDTWASAEQRDRSRTDSLARWAWMHGHRVEAELDRAVRGADGHLRLVAWRFGGTEWGVHRVTVLNRRRRQDGRQDRWLFGRDGLTPVWIEPPTRVLAILPTAVPDAHPATTALRDLAMAAVEAADAVERAVVAPGVPAVHARDVEEVFRAVTVDLRGLVGDAVAALQSEYSAAVSGTDGGTP